MKSTKEWFVDAPWGKIAMVSWGDATKSPILLMHGYMDSAATFIPLVNIMPDSYHYVGVDLPGHGKSDHFPVGPLVSQVQMVDVIQRVVDYMEWNTFVFMGHSMAFLLGIFYNAVHPGKITKMINIDPGPPISMYYYPVLSTDFWYQYLYQEYYDAFHRNYSKPPLYKYDDALNLVVRRRNLTEDEAEVVLSRSLIPVDDKYRLSWSPAMKKIVNLPIDAYTLTKLITNNSPPMLNIAATENNTIKYAKRFGENVVKNVLKKKRDFFVITVNGGHDVHITSPETFVQYVNEFLDTDYNRRTKKRWCKL